MIEIMNLKHETPFQPYDFKIDRSTPLGNPFTDEKHESREESCSRYREYFRTSEIYKGSYMGEMKKALMKYGRLRLFCWCSPKTCHGEIIKEYLEEWVKSNDP